MTRRRTPLRALLPLAGVAALAVAGCGGSSSSSSSNTGTSSSSSTKTTKAASTGGGQTIHLAANPSQLKFNVKTLSAKAGKVTLVMANPANFSHGVAIQGHGVNQVGQVVGHGGTSTVTATLKPGRYVFYCPVPGHRQAGMVGVLTVT